MIDKLHIKNFLAFPELLVPELKQINLVAGKNNSGKTALLDALRLYTTLDKEEIGAMIARRRGGLGKYSPNTLMYSNEGVMSVKASINELDIISASTLRDVDYKVDGFSFRKQIEPQYELLRGEEYEYISAQVSNHDWIASRWGEFVLTDREMLITKILREATGEKIDRIAVTGKDVLVKVTQSEKPVNISRFGDGLTRVLQIAMALITARPNASNLNGLLLIDEIETHLHHSVIRKLWKIIFEYAVKWNIQVVATTHSQDAIRQFWYEAATQEAYKELCQVLRLQVGRSGKHEVIQFPFDRLDSVMEMEMEIR